MKASIYQMFKGGVSMFWRLFKRTQIQIDEQKIKELRSRGVRIGQSCRIYATEFSTEPYLIDIGDNVAIAGGAKFLTHNGLASMIRDKYPGIQVFGRIRIGSRSFIGQDAILLPGTEIGQDCIIGAGAVVRGKIPDDSLVIGNPAKIIGKATDVLAKLETSPNRLDLYDVSAEERRKRLEKHFSVT
jgi:acetyltransferase-like isoleucine patch superfamily enzyme